MRNGSGKRMRRWPRGTIGYPRCNLVYQQANLLSHSHRFMEASGRQVPEYGCHKAPKGTRPRQIADRSHIARWALISFLGGPITTNKYLRTNYTATANEGGYLLQLALHRLLRRFSFLTKNWHQIWRPSRQFHRIFLVLPVEGFMRPLDLGCHDCRAKFATYKTSQSTVTTNV